LKDTIALALYLKERNMRPRQIQDFIPTPMAIATAMYHTGIDPLTGEPVPVVRDLREKRMMKALILWWDDKQWPLAREALRKAGRADLIGKRPECLVPPDHAERQRGTVIQLDATPRTRRGRPPRPRDRAPSRHRRS
jgi:hypothetical protein